MMTGTRLAAFPALLVTRDRSSGVSWSAVSSVTLAFNTAPSSFRSCSVSSTGSRMSLFFTELSLSITTRMKLPLSARIRSNRRAVSPADRAAMA